MYALKQQAIDLMVLPSDDGATTVGPSFEYLPPEVRHHAQHGKIVVFPTVRTRTEPLCDGTHREIHFTAAEAEGVGETRPAATTHGDSF